MHKERIIILFSIYIRAFTFRACYEQTLGNSEAQGSLEICSPCGHKESDMA